MVDNKLIVNTLNGPIRGKNYETVFGKQILAFHRIPYIRTPTGKLRFKDPEPVDNWNEVLDCSLPPIPSLNRSVRLGNIVEGDETAIHINAYTATLKPNVLRPVMIWIHGGGFVSESSITSVFAPDFLLEKDIVLFTFNYRLSVLGFLNLDDPKLGVPGNAGLKDQTMAIRWIKDNCNQFGGDPSNITLFGESAGGASVHYHTVSELSRGLFNKAIIMSGSITAPWACVENKNFGLRLAKLLGWNEDEPKEKALEILQNAPGETLLFTVATLLTPQERLVSVEPFVPSIESYVSEQCFIPMPVAEMMIDPWSKNLPMIISATSAEGLLFAMFTDFTRNEQLYDRLGDFEIVVPKELAINNAARKKEFGLRLKKFYYGDDKPSLANYRRYCDMVSDKYFIYPTHVLVKSRASNATAPTYLLRFAFDSPTFNHFKVTIVRLENEKGACHADDISYLFKNDMYELTGGLKTGSREHKTMERMVALYTNFAATSDPNGPETEPVKWEPITGENLPHKCLNVEENLEFIDWPESSRVAIWDQLYTDDLN